MDVDKFSGNQSDGDESISSSEGSISEVNIKDIEDLRKRIKENEFDYDAHVSLVSNLRKTGELEETRKAREQMNKVYPLSPELWMEWLSDEQKVCTTDEERAFIKTLFEKAVKEYMSVKIWVEYMMFALGGGDQKETRAICDRALTAVGIHLAEGILVWQTTYLVEQQYFVAIQAKGDQKFVDEQKKRIQNLFKRQSRVPLMDTDKQEFMSEAVRWFDDGKVEPNIKSELDKSYKKMLEKLPYEEALLKAEDEVAKLEAYRKYLDLVRAKDNPTVIQNIYERTVTDLCLNAGLWEEYVRFVMEQFPHADFVVLPVCERSQLNCPWSGSLCDLHITALHRFEQTVGEAEVAKRIKGALQITIASGVVLGSELVKSWMSYLVYLRMKIDWNEEHKEQLKRFQDSCQSAKDAIDERCGEEGDIECDIARFEARIEAESAKNIEGARIIWNEHIMKRNQNFKNANFWMEFINLERSYGTVNYCRKLFRRALERVWDGVEVIGHAFIRFEQQLGDLNTMADYEQRYRDRLSVVHKKRMEDAAKEEREKEKDRKQHGNRDYLPQTNTELSRKKTPVINSSAGSSKVEHRTDPPKVAPPPGYKRKAEEEVVSPSKKPRVEPSHGEFVKHDSSFDIQTVFLSNLDYQTEDKDILPIFADCGEVDALRITRDFKGRSKGFGYLIFKQLASVEKALKLDRSPINGRPMFVSRCNPHERDPAFKFSTTLEKEKLFVRGLPYAMKEEDVRKAFEPHGKIKSIRLVTHRNGYSKGTCYIDYYDAETAANVLKMMNGSELQGFTISVYVSNPSANKSTRNEFVKALSQPGPSKVNATQRPKLSFVPRALMKKTEEKKISNSNGSQEESKPKSNADFRNLLLK